MSSPSLLRPRINQLRALAIGVVLGLSLPAYAADLPEVQRLVKQGKHQQALEAVDAYLSSRPKDAQGRFLKGLIYTEMNKPTEAIGVFTKLTQDYPELPEPYNNLAVLYAQQKQYDKARTALEMAIRTHPSYAIAYENLGDVYAKLASQAYDKALQLDNSNAATQNKLALIRDLITTGSPAKPTGKSGGKQQQASAAVVSATPGAAARNVESKPAATPLAATPPTPVAAQAAPAVAAASVAAASVAAPPVATPVAPAAGVFSDPVADELSATVAAWADAWSRKDMAAYLGAYAPDFQTPKGMSREEWQQEREQRIAGRAGAISVRVEAPQIAVNGDEATVRFRQHYKATGLTNTASKTLVFARVGGKWLIREEISR